MYHPIPGCSREKPWIEDTEHCQVVAVKSPGVRRYARWSREKPWIFHSMPGGAVKSPVVLTVNFFCKAIITNY